jgi:hypothetical protein
MSTLSHTIEGVTEAVAAVGDYVADKVRPKPPKPPRSTPAVRRAAITLKVGRRPGR